ncbi:2-oxoglutarate receptor 1-like [Engraulis encrasicolus]|uniref:2-oxoglutarate receptor 1-like n=1 Tax=Engraulis encrasicolus TaxID=184585 RepID=UPI002FCE8BD6
MIYLPIMYGLIFMVGLVGNVTALVVYLVKLRPLSSSSIIMVNLTIADLLYILTLPFLVHFYYTGQWEFGDFMCRLVRSCFHFNLYGSILLLTVLSVFRYVVVVYPLKAETVNRPSFAVICCLAAWLLCVIITFPVYGLIKADTGAQQEHSCIDFASQRNVWVYGWILTVLGFLIPLFAVCLSYSCVARALSSGGVLPTRSTHLQARRLAVVTLLVFVVCFTPYHVLRQARMYTAMMSNVSPALEVGVHAAYIISRPLAALNTLFDLALVTLAGDRFQQALRSLLHWNGCLFYRAAPPPRSFIPSVYRPRGSSGNGLIEN